MTPFDLPLCPCCTGAMLHTLAQNASWLTSQSLLQLGKGALVARLGVGEAKLAESTAAPVTSPTPVAALLPSMTPAVK